MRALRREVGQLLIGSFEGRTLDQEFLALARDFNLSGVILFARNVESPEQVAELAIDVQRLGREWPLWVSVDQEGGRVARLKRPFTEWPPMATLGRSGDVQLAERFARALAAELKAVGISLDYAPVLDIQSNPDNTVVGDRALADRAELVARLGATIIRVLQEAGVAACGKHFPGHGDTTVDSHDALPLVEHPPDRIRRVELVPFRAAIEARVAAIITAHVLIPSLDEERPATLSRAIVHDLLRKELGFEGMILTDDLEMGAIVNTWGLGDAAVQAIAAGCDGLLVCRGHVEKQVQVLEALIHAVENEMLSVKRVEDAIARQRRAKERFLTRFRPPAPSDLRALVGSSSHQAVADEMARYL